MKVIFAASSGGHYAQLLQLKPAMEKCESVIITEKTDSIKKEENMYFLKQTNRREWNCFFYELYNLFYSIYILIKECPDMIVTTGVLAMIPLCLMGKLFGAKLVYIESFAKIKSGTMTGKFLYRFADKFFVQWESMKKVYPKAEYLGGLY